MRPRPFVLAALVASLAGLFFASFSTYDFVEHLDRQVHELHCSFIPGLGHTDATGSSGCHVTLMSPYSSVLRTTVWGGIPISLPGMSVFAFLAFWCLYLLITRRDRDRRAVGFLALATALPLAMSLTMGTISLVTLHAACKLCIGIYISSVLAFTCAVFAWRTGVRQLRAVQGAADTMPADRYDPRDDPFTPPSSWGALAAAFALGLAFVVVPVLVYVSTLPNYARYVGTCGTLPQPALADDISVPLDHGASATATPAIEILDPLCPSCRAFESRLDASGLGERLSRRAVLFPLDHDCNWMVDETVHPGACVVSRAVLCAGGDARAVLDWAFEHQDEIKESAAHDHHAAEHMVAAQFPGLATCVSAATTRARLDRSLRWAVQNRLPVITPQLYVGDRKLCDEDTDLGMDYALSRMLNGNGG